MPEFITPPPFGTVGDYSNDQNYALGSTIEFSWSGSTADTQGMNLWLKADLIGFTCTELNLANTQCWLIHSNNQGTSFEWYVNIPDFEGTPYNSNEPHYWIHMYDSQNTFGGVFGSHYFNVLPSSLMPASATLTQTPSTTSSTSSSTNPPATTTSSSDSATITSSSSSSTSSSSSLSQSSSMSGITSSSTSGTASVTSGAGTSATSAAASSSASASGGTSDSTKIALGVGLGVGIPLIIVLAVIAWLLFRNNRRKEAKKTSMMERNSYNAPPTYQDAPEYYKPQQPQPERVHEMSGQNFRITSPSELDAHPYR